MTRLNGILSDLDLIEEVVNHAIVTSIYEQVWQQQESQTLRLFPSQIVFQFLSNALCSPMLGFGNPELQNRVTHYDVISRVTNSGFFTFFIFRVANSSWKSE